MQARRIMQQALGKVFDAHDVLTSPTLPMLATKPIDKLETTSSYSDPLGAGGNLAGLPSFSVP